MKSLLHVAYFQDIVCLATVIYGPCLTANPHPPE
jgi:hypothetical protein